MTYLKLILIPEMITPLSTSSICSSASDLKEWWTLSQKVSYFQVWWTQYPPGFGQQRQTTLKNMSFCLDWVCICVITRTVLTDMCVCVWMRVCLCVWLCARLLYNKHWSKTGPSCLAAAVTTNKDYPLPAPQFLLHNHQTKGEIRPF